MTDSRSSSRILSSNSNQLCPLLKETLHGLEETKDPDELRRFEWILKLLRDSAEAQLAESMSPDELQAVLEDLLSEVDTFTQTTEPQIAVRNAASEEVSLPYTMISLVLPEYPFTVDSVIEWLSGESIEIHHLFHGPLSTEAFSGSKQTDRTTSLLTLFVERLPEDSIHRQEEHLRTLADDLTASVEDFREMLEQTRSLREQISDLSTTSSSSPMNRPDVVGDFLDYLIDDHFVFLGHYRSNSQEEITYENLLGICRDDLTLDLTAVDPTRANQDDPPLLQYYKTNVEGRVYRRERLDSVVLQDPTEEGVFHVILGLFTNQVLSEPAVQVPLLHEKFDRIVDRQDLSEHTHSYRDYYTIYNSMPKHLLLMSDVDDIIDDLKSILSVRGDRTFKLRARPNPLQRGLSIMILMEQDRFSGAVRKQMQATLEDELAAQSVDYQLSLGTGGLARLHFDVVTDRLRPRKTSYEDLENSLFNMTRTWEDHFRRALQKHYSSDRAQTLSNRYADGFGDEYCATVEPDTAAGDVDQLEELRDPSRRGPLAVFSNSEDREATRLTLLGEEKISLNETLPILSNHGFQVEEQSTFPVTTEESTVFLHLFELTDDSGSKLELPENNALVPSVRGVLRDRYRNDELNELVYREGLTPRMVNLLRLYKNYFHQLVPAIKMETINRSLVQYPEYSSRLVEFFETKFDPDRPYEDRPKTVHKTRESLADDLEDLDERTTYQIFRRMLDFLSTTVRTNYYQPDYPDADFETADCTVGESKPYISVKIESGKLTELIESSVRYEVFVYSPYMEAVHLRSGEIARGGIRWSDRRDDYRTEIAELMETQKKKNALIVPVGAKGGFILKEEYLPDEPPLDQQARQQYTTFMRGLLDLTDNIVSGEVHTPPNLVTYDGNDPYLVVAADKGTATFSDCANTVADKYNFWLEDAFASGGSTGYDHKEVGITARGGWECVERHFRELGRDLSQETFTVTGIGDMGGDVFGNGMILSDKIKLVAAFNHRHIFLDPDPDPETSFEERKRLFEGDQSGWEGYGKGLISEGGGVYDRNASIITLEDPARELLGLEKSEYPPDTIIQSILKANVDLLWNGGIGTYIKSSEESHSEVEDPQNDSFRVDAPEVQADVIGEGGNLGITQRGRVELAQQGTRLYTDFIDNSGGVDLSDREVNLKILLRKSIELEEIEAADRENHLEAFRNHAIEEVLRDNYRQSGTISLEARNSVQHLEDVRSLLNTLEENDHFQRNREHFPDDQELDDRQRAGEGLTRPEAAVLLSAVKQDLYRRSLEDSWPEETILAPFLERYLPDDAPSTLAQGVENHPLKKNIALTELVNYAVDSVGYSFFHKLRDQLGTDLITILKAFRTADYFSKGESIRNLLFEQDGVLDPNVQYEAWTTFSERIGHVVSWLVDTINESLVYHGFQNRIREALQDRFDTVRETLREPQADYYRQKIHKWEERGFPTAFGEKIARLTYLVPALEIILVHQDCENRDFRELSETYFELGQILNVDWIIRQVYEREPQSRWDELAFRSLGVEAHNIQRDVLDRIIQDQHSLDEFIDQNETTINRLNELQNKLAQENTQKFSAYQYMVQRIRSLL